jgi:hypothetical protein
MKMADGYSLPDMQARASSFIETCGSLRRSLAETLNANAFTEGSAYGTAEFLCLMTSARRNPSYTRQRTGDDAAQSRATTSDSLCPV